MTTASPSVSASKTRMRVSTSIGTLAIIASLLIGIGQKSFGLSGLVILAVLGSWIYTDWLNWIRLNRHIAYIAMLAGAGFAFWDYVRAGSAEQLGSVANLLVYAQLPLFFQSKDRRIYEQIGVFLILEFVVAALLNNNVLFGFLLIPALATGCWTLILFTLYTSEEQVGRKSLARRPWYQQVTDFLFARKAKVQTEWLLANIKPAGLARSSIRFYGIGAPLTLIALFLAAAYFYVLPRLNEGSYGSGGFGQTTVGFNDVLQLDQIGKMLQSDKPVLRVEFQHRDGRVFRPFEPPYLRGAALAHYTFVQNRGTWQSGLYSNSTTINSKIAIPEIHLARESFLEGTETMVAKMSEQSATNGYGITLAPFFRSGDVGNFDFDEDSWQLFEKNPTESERRKYDMLVQAFDRGIQSPFLPESEEILEQSLRGHFSHAEPPYQDLSPDQLETLLDFSASRFSKMLALRDRVFEKNNAKDLSKVDQALMLEDHLANSGEFEHTLDLTMARDRMLDPCEDFVRNQKKGNCQMFASTFALTLRSIGVPSRIVTGYRPNEYNTVGNFFLVRQLHAHAWVEAYFTRAQFESALSLRLPSKYNRGAWVRFDPTPPGNGSNAGGTLKPPEQQTLDFAQEWWKDNVMNVDRKSRSNIFEVFGTSSGSAYQSYIIQFQAWLNKLQQSQFLGGFLSPDRWLSWQGAVLAIAFIAMSVAFWRFRHLLNPFLFLKGGRKKKSKRALNRVTNEAYLRCINSLARLGFRRTASQTHREFASYVSAELSKLASVEIPFQQLTEKYCQFRYGNDGEATEELSNEAAQMEALLRSLQR